MKNELLLELIREGRSKLLQVAKLLLEEPDKIDIFYHEGIFFDAAIQKNEPYLLNLLLSFLETNILQEEASKRDVTRGYKFLSDLWTYLEANFQFTNPQQERYLGISANSKRIFNDYIGVEEFSKSSNESYYSTALLGDADLMLEQDIFNMQGLPGDKSS